MLAVGDAIPDVRVWMAPQEPVSLRELAAEKPLLLLFYLFDWSKGNGDAVTSQAGRTRPAPRFAVPPGRDPSLSPIRPVP